MLSRADRELLREIVRLLRILAKETPMTQKTLDDLLADVQANTNLVGSVAATISGMAAQIAALKTPGTDPGTAAKIDALAQQVESNNTAFQKAITDNTSLVTGEAIESAPPLDENGLRTDGPTLSEFTARGYAASGYPPTGYADKRTPEELAAAKAAADAAAAAGTGGTDSGTSGDGGSTSGS